MIKILLIIIIPLLPSCEKGSDHARASRFLFGESTLEQKKEGFDFLYDEYEKGSIFSAGKIGWAYQKGIVVEKNIDKAIELYNIAANGGMTYWQYMLAHAYEMGYLGLEKNNARKDYWLNHPNKVHIDIYECWIEYFYAEGYYPKNNALEAAYADKCKTLQNKNM